jgi:hypothetical protein
MGEASGLHLSMAWTLRVFFSAGVVPVSVLTFDTLGAG